MTFNSKSAAENAKNDLQVSKATLKSWHSLLVAACRDFMTKNVPKVTENDVMISV